MNQSVARCIDDHLDAIDKSLRKGELSRSERQSILDDVETQIRDMLLDRAPGEASVEDARAVLAEMDPPESYVGEEKSAPVGREEKVKGMIVSGELALWLCVLSPAILLLVVMFYKEGLSGGLFTLIVFSFLFPFLGIAFILGIIAGSRPMGRAAYIISGIEMVLLRLSSS